jgi:ABC-2 type transport system ATP-binding protein
MKRRIDLAAALVHNPQVLFLDEPTTGLDPESRFEVWDEVRRLNSELGLTVFLTTQHLEEADALADRIGIIRSGRLVAEGTPIELKRLIGEAVIVIDTASHDPSLIGALQALDGVTAVAVEGTTIIVNSEDPARSLAPLSQELTRSDVQIRSLNLRAPTLDEVFRHVVRGERTPAAVR